MTDNEIIKALECCAKDEWNCDYNCPFFEKCSKTLMAKSAFNLINQQKADIERLQESGKEAVSCFTRMESLYKIKCKELEVAKSEAIKEFIDELKNRVVNKYEYTDIRVFKEIDNLVKEMTEGVNKNDRQ